MVCNIYTNKSDNKVINKNIELLSDNLSISLLDDTSLYNPYLILNKNVIADFPYANYVYIPDFKRYYYIDNIEFLTGGHVGITCTCDVLMSFKDYILNQVCVLDRQESNANLYLPDNEMIYQANEQTQVLSFPISLPQDNANILIVAGGITSQIESEV